VRLRLWLPVGIVAVVWLGLWTWSTPKAQPAIQAQEPIPPPLIFKYLGAGSCASVACHSGQGTMGATGSEYTTWASHDLHARAHDVLYNERSQRITRLLRRDKAASQDTLCLKCHVHPGYYDNFPVQDSKTFRGDGVSCEVCHGPGEKYVAEHYKTAWKSLSAKEKATYGMHDLKPLSNRVSLCVDCHVGTKDSDVNHDLIAAGHPRLAFEFSSYHGIWNRHWPDRLDRDPKYGGVSDFEIRAWAQGQAQCAKRALELLASRASGAGQDHPGKPWPEFAEYDCYACHHNLTKDSWRQQQPGGNKGMVPWSRWYYSQVILALPGSEPEYSLAKIRVSMEKGFGKSDPALVLSLTKKALNSLETRRPSLETLANLEGLYRKIMDQDPRTWDDGAQMVLLLSALLNTWKDVKNPPSYFSEVQSKAARMRQELIFDAHFDSPKSFDPDRSKRQAVSPKR
jgi:hypothetical protein